jgi:hypothetical protein
MRDRAILLLVLVALVVAACGSEATSTTTSGPDESTTSTRPATTTTVDPFRVETDRIIQAWIDGWLADDPAPVVVLYGEDSVYADKGCPFEMIGKPAIRGMVTGHMGATTYTVADPVEITYTQTGAVVQWIWGGTHRGDEFTMDASTTFEIENGLILRSTDSYDRADVPSAWEQDCIEYNAGN